MRVRPQANELEGAVAWLTAHRTGTGWRPNKAKGPALAALAAYYAHAQLAEDRYKLTVTVNDTKLAELNIVGATPGQAIPVPLKVVKVGQPNRVRFDMEGRGRYGYAVTMQGFTRDFGPDQNGANRVAVVSRRVYLPAAPELEGKVLPTGFGVAVNAEPFANIATQVAARRQGSRADHGASQYSPEHSGMGSRFSDRRGTHAGGYDADRGLCEHRCHVL